MSVSVRGIPISVLCQTDRIVAAAVSAVEGYEAANGSIEPEKMRGLVYGNILKDFVDAVTLDDGFLVSVENVIPSEVG